MTTFKDELKKILLHKSGIIRFRIIGHICYGRIDYNSDIIVKMYFTTGFAADDYSSLELSLININAGEIDSIQLKFSEILGKRQIDHPNYPNGYYPHMSKKGPEDIEWVLYEPVEEDYALLAQAVYEYVTAFAG